MSETDLWNPKLRPWLEQGRIVAKMPSRARCDHVAAALSRSLVTAGFNTVLDGERVRFSRGLANWVRARLVSFIDGGELRVFRTDGKLSVSYRINFVHYPVMVLAMALFTAFVVAHQEVGWWWMPVGLAPLALLSGLSARFAFRDLLRRELERP